MNDQDVLFAYFGHHKCATQWIRGTVRAMSKRIGRDVVVYNGSRDFDKNLGAAISDPGSTFLCYINAERRYVRQVPALRGFHVVRDPRDVVVSAYFSHLYSHPLYGRLEEERKQLQTLSKSDGLMLELAGRRHQFRAMLTWDYDRPDVLELRMEDLTTRADEEFGRIVEFLGLSRALPKRRVQRIVAARDFKKLAGRAPGEEDVKSHYRKGVPGDWVNHFGPEHVEYFKEHYNELLLRLGYETSPDWG